MVSYAVFMATFTLATFGGLVVGLYIFGDFRSLSKEGILNGVKNNWMFVVLLGLVLLLILIENYTHDMIYGFLQADFTYLIYEWSFRGVIGVSIQNGLRSSFADVFFIAVYLYTYTYVLFFTPLMYMVRNDKKRMKQYTLAIILNFIILLPFYFLFAVRTPGLSGLVSTEPILYSNPNLLQFVNEVDPLDNCFPSGHIAVPFIVFFLLIPLRKHSQYRHYGIFIGILCFFITTSVFYLGVHWVADVISAILVAAFCVWVAKKPEVMRWFNTQIPILLSRFKSSKFKDDRVKSV